MAYVDDWLNTPTSDRKRLEEVCRTPGCSHARYIHGSTQQMRQSMWRWIEHTPGKCTRCKCDAFADENAITKNEVLDVHDTLAHEWHLADIGITAVSCEQKITRWLEAGPTDLPCRLTFGHEGTHEAKE